MKYALIAYDLPGFYFPDGRWWRINNTGNAMQSVAAAGFLPHIDMLLPYLRLDEFEKLGKDSRIILNAFWDKVQFAGNDGWFQYGKIPSLGILRGGEQLPLSMHFNLPLLNLPLGAQPPHLAPEVKEWCLQHEPIGTRDIVSCDYLLSEGVKAYFSGCLTLTLKPNPEIKKQDYVVACSLSSQMRRWLREKTERPVYDLSRVINSNFGSALGEFEVCELILDLLQGAHCVLTSRLHIALPCLALGTPVLFLHRQGAADFQPDISNTSRLSGLLPLMHNASEEAYMQESELFDLENPPSNKPDFLEIRRKLIDTCNDFLQGDSVYDVEKGRLPVAAKLSYANMENHSMRQVNMLKGLIAEVIPEQHKKMTGWDGGHSVNSHVKGQKVFVKGETYALFGAGEFGKEAYIAILYYGGKVSCYIDNDKRKHGEHLWDAPIVSLEDYLRLGSPGRIVISCGPDNREAIMNQLQKYGIKDYIVLD